MSLSSHLEELRRKHENLKAEVEEAQRSPGYDQYAISDLKKQKLKVKEEIFRLSAA